jgi:hypothetical protein
VKHTHWTFISAAVAHVQKVDADADKTASAIYYLRVLSKQFQTKGFYDLAAVARQLAMRIDQDKAVNPVYKELRSMYSNRSAGGPVSETPTSNTGVKPVFATALEDYFSGHA